MLLSVTELRLRTTSHKNIFWFELVAQGQLMRLGEDFALDEFTAKTVTPLVTVESWTPESAQRLSTQFESALDDLAGRFVSEWIKPRLLGAH